MSKSYIDYLLGENVSTLGGGKPNAAHVMISVLFRFRQQLHVYHWQTTSYSQHQAFGGIYDELNDLIDKFVEVCMGKHGRPRLTDGVMNIEIIDIDELSIDDYVNSCVDFLISLNDVYETTDSDLLNIRDEMMAEFNKLKYLLTLK